MDRWILSSFVIVVTLACHSTTFAERPIVPSFERFHGQPPVVDEDVDDEDLPVPRSDAAGGRLLAGELGCTACHRVGGQSRITPKKAPFLDGVAARVRPAYLSKFIANPAKTKDGTTMPNVFAGQSADQVKADVEAIVHYLESLGPHVPEQAYAKSAARIRGKTLYHEAGCVACHGARRDKEKTLATSKPLGTLDEKYTLVSLTSFLQNPHKTRPSGRMPSLNLTKREAGDIAAFLLPSVPEATGIAWELYKGRFERLPDFSKLKPVASGDSEVISIEVTPEREQFALRFQGVLTIDEPGEYTFHSRSDDGSKVYVNKELVVDNDGVHPEVDRSGKKMLTPGRYSVTVEFFELGGGERILVELEGPGVQRQPLANFLTSTKPEVPLDDLSFAVDAGLARKGQRIFRERGCAQCHQVGNESARTVEARPWSELRPQGGCLDGKTAGLPHYALSKKQRETLIAAIAETEPNKAAREVVRDRIDHTMATFNCFACHAREERGGVEPTRVANFKTTQPEMGFEGSVPPGLDTIGAKLTEDWLKHILADGADDRPYMHTRMPKFGLPNVAHLVDDFAKFDLSDATPPPKSPVTAESKRAGWQIVGAKGFSCIKCHTFGRFRATGVQSIDLTILRKRLRHDWFVRYLRNPQQFRRGTRMPSAWPPQLAKSSLSDLLDGDPARQIEAVWHYLGDGPRARVPVGLVSRTLELIATEDAVIYRNFIEGAGTRAIGVGYPEGLNLAFDANEMRLALIWQGAFIDAQRHWNGRGQGFQPPLGNKVVALPAGSAFAELESNASDWPTQTARELGHRFRGYRLTPDRRPTFLYRIGDCTIEDSPNAVDAGVGSVLVRTIRVTSKSRDAEVTYRAAKGEIEELGEGWYRIGPMKTRLETERPPVLRGDVLLVTLKAGDVITQTYEW